MAAAVVVSVVAAAVAVATVAVAAAVAVATVAAVAAAETAGSAFLPLIGRRYSRAPSKMRSVHPRAERSNLEPHHLSVP